MFFYLGSLSSGILISSDSPIIFISQSGFTGEGTSSFMPSNHIYFDELYSCTRTYIHWRFLELFLYFLRFCGIFIYEIMHFKIMFNNWIIKKNNYHDFNYLYYFHYFGQIGSVYVCYYKNTMIVWITFFHQLTCK